MAKFFNTQSSSSTETVRADYFLNLSLPDDAGTEHRVGKTGIPLYADNPLHKFLIDAAAKGKLSAVMAKMVAEVKSSTPVVKTASFSL